jgi:hypothetical protein
MESVHGSRSGPFVIGDCRGLFSVFQAAKETAAI